MIGIDIVNIERFKNIISGKLEKKFLGKIFTENELKQCEKESKKTRAEYLACRYAIKEAVIKASDGELTIFDLKNIEICQEEFGIIIVNVSNVSNKKLERKEYKVSLSHNGKYIIGIAIKS